MKVRRFAGRIGKLEEKIDVPEFERGSTRIAWECLSWREQRLFERIHEILREHSDGLGGVSAEALLENRDVLMKGTEIMYKRVFDLLSSFMEPFLKGEKLYEWIFWGRFHAFLVTTLNIIEMRRREDLHLQQIQEKYGDEWPEKIGEPDLTGVGERDFNKALKQLLEDSHVFLSESEEPREQTH